MSNSIKVDVVGFDELHRKIEALSGDKLKKTEIIGILRQVAGSTVSQAKANAPISKRLHYARRMKIRPKNLKNSIGVIVGRRGQAKENPTVYVGTRAKGSFNGWYGHFVEEDTNVYAIGHKRKSRKRGANVGSAAAVKIKKGQHFLRKAYESTEGKVSAEATAKVARYIQRRIDKLS